LLEVAANIAEIIAGIAILIAAIKAWPVFTRMDGLTRKRNKAGIKADLQRYADAIEREYGVQPEAFDAKTLVTENLNALNNSEAFDLHFEYLPGQREFPGRISYTGRTRGADIARPELVCVSHDGYLELIDTLKELSSSTDETADVAYIDLDTHRFVLNMSTTLFAPVATLRLAPRLVLKPEQLGMVGGPWWPEIATALEEAKPGVIVCAGPLGSGKSTTAAAIVEYASRNKTWKVASAEFPVEFLKDDIMQFSCNGPAKFNDAYTAAMSQNPDILFVSSPECGEYLWAAYGTRKTTIGSVTAHDAAAALEMINRQGKTAIKTLDIPFTIIGQHLAGILCKECRQPYTPDPVDEQNFDLIEKENNSGRHPMTIGHKYALPTGCENCVAGYSGRIALHEYLIVSPEMLTATIRESAYDIRRIAIQQGMNNLQYQALYFASIGMIDVNVLKRISTELNYSTTWSSP